MKCDGCGLVFAMSLTTVVQAPDITRELCIDCLYDFENNELRTADSYRDNRFTSFRQDRFDDLWRNRCGFCYVDYPRGHRHSCRYALQRHDRGYATTVWELRQWQREDDGVTP